MLTFFTLKQKMDKELEITTNYETCDRIIRNIFQYKETDRLNQFPSEISKDQTHQNTRLAWCHGDLGNAAAIFNASCW
ncbi:MAG: hypothetical protein IT246_09590 [Bacteroidia bacterium]|nr:hypothetical protein [Bacteroidia bacterium]